MNAPINQQIQKTPDITLTGEQIEQMFAFLNNAIIFAKSPDGSMRPFIDPNPIKQLLSVLIQVKLNPQGGNDGLTS
jgi:hypothetical protein